MKRFFSLVLVISIFALCTPRAAQAEDRKIGFLVNLGFMTRKGTSSPWVTMGPELALPLGTLLSFNPEVTIWGSNFGFRTFYVVPGALANVRIGRFTVGAGVVRRFWVSGYGNGDSSEKLAPKIQLGYRTRFSRISFIIVPLSSQNYVSFGLALGMGF
jgi:hypothetical protein